jgi:hypothetical protein
MTKIKPAFFSVVIFISILIFSVKEAPADYIHLNNGSVISGVLIEEKGNLLIYRTPDGEMFINRDNVTKIISEPKDKPLLREADVHLKNHNFKQAIKTCGEVLEIKPDSVEALELKRKAITAWRNYEALQEEKIRKAEERRIQEAEQLKEMQTTLKTKWGISIKKENKNYIIADVYYNCPLKKGEIKPGDILIAIQNTNIETLPAEKIYDILSSLKKIDIVIRRSVTLTREKITWQGTKEYAGLGISIEKVDKGIKITNLMPNGPSAKAGLLKDDILIDINNRSTGSCSMDQIIEMLKGKAGTSLMAIIERTVIFQ